MTADDRVAAALAAKTTKAAVQHPRVRRRGWRAARAAVGEDRVSPVSPVRVVPERHPASDDSASGR